VPQAANVLEIVVFTLNEGVTRDQLLATAGPVSAWIAGQPGFVSRELAYDADGDRWIDVVGWQTMADARAAAERAMTSESCAPMFALIDMDSILMIHGEAAMAPVHAAATAAR
jgi:hypothetical protein